MHGHINIKFVVYTLQRNVRLFSVQGHEHNFYGVHLFVILGPKTKANDGKPIDSIVFVFMCEV
jgi:hypothetical protein